jgi:large subunit ribosomal protein L10
MDREQKAAQIEELKTAFGEAEAIFAVDYRGISVPQAAELRASLREADAAFRIVKNRLAKLAIADSGTDGLETLLEGPTALTFVKGDPVVAAKAISTFNREHEVLEFKGGVMEGAALDPDQFKAIARLPAVEVLHGQLAGLTASPLTGLVRGLGSMISGLAVALGQIQERGLVSGEAEPEAPAEDAAADEAPAEDASEDAGGGEGADSEEPATETEEPAAESGDGEEPAAEDTSEAEEPAADEAPAAEAEAGEAAAEEEPAAEDGDGEQTETETEDESKEDE